MSISVVENGLYTIKDKFFQDYAGEPPYPYMHNDKECRPYFYLFKDKDGVLWVIPMSKQVDTYKRKIARIEATRGKGNCIFYHTGIIAGIERAFSIGDMFPVTEEYIKAPFTIGPNHYVVRDEKLLREIRSRAMKFLRLVEQGKVRSDLNIMDTKHRLLEGKK